MQYNLIYECLVDHSRVELTVSEGDEGTDYINASWINVRVIYDIV